MASRIVSRVIRERNGHRRLLLAVLAAPVALLTLGGFGLARQGTLVMHQCVPVSGADGWLGVQLALLRADSDCPPGALAIGGDAHHAMGVVAMVALPVLLAHLAGVSLWLGLTTMLQLLIDGAVTLLRHVIPALPAQADSMVVPRGGHVATPFAPALAHLVTSCVWRRGPPTAHTA